MRRVIERLHNTHAVFSLSLSDNCRLHCAQLAKESEGPRRAHPHPHVYILCRLKNLLEMIAHTHLSPRATHLFTEQFGFVLCINRARLRHKKWRRTFYMGVGQFASETARTKSLEENKNRKMFYVQSLYSKVTLKK